MGWSPSRSLRFIEIITNKFNYNGFLQSKYHNTYITTNAIQVSLGAILTQQQEMENTDHCLQFMIIKQYWIEI